MNKLIPLTIVATLSFLSSTYGQALNSTTSKLSTVQSINIPAGSTRLVGINVVKPVLAAGILDSESANAITDTHVNFTTALSEQSNLWVEITSGPNRGIASLITSYSQTVLTTEDNLTSFCSPGDKYEIRAAHTIASLFGTTNQAGLKPSTDATGSGSPDLVKVPDGAGGFSDVFYSTSAAGWRKTGSSANMANLPIYHIDGVYIVRNSTMALNLKIAGLTRSTPTFYGVGTGSTSVFNTVYPTGSTLGNSGLASQLQQGSETTADIISFTNSSGALVSYYYLSGAGWRQIGDATTDRANVSFSSAFTLLRRGTTGNIKAVPASAYTNL